MKLSRGLLIVFEGIDGAGKSTQCQRLADHLKALGLDVRRLREPTDGPFGRAIRSHAQNGTERLSLGEELELFIEDRKENVRQNIEPILAHGAVVVMDRYYFSTMAYQGARGLDPEQIRLQNEAFAPRPDLIVYLRISEKTAVERITASRGDKPDLFEKEEYLARVKEIFDSLPDPQKVTIDAECDEERVFSEVRRAADDLIARFSAQP